MFREQSSSLHDVFFLISVFLMICISFFFLLNGCETESSTWKLRYVSESLSFCLQNHLWWISWLLAVAICLQVLAIASKFQAENLRNTYGHYTAYVILLWHICFSICAVVEFREDGTANSNLKWWIYKNVNEEQMHYFSTACFLIDLFVLHLIYFNMSVASYQNCSVTYTLPKTDDVPNVDENFEQLPVFMRETPAGYRKLLDNYHTLDFVYAFLLIVFVIFMLLQLTDLARIVEWMIVFILFLLQFFAFVRLRMLKKCKHQTDSGLVPFRNFVALTFLFYVAFTIISTLLIAPLHIDFMLDTKTSVNSETTTMKTGAEFTIMVTIVTAYISFIAFIF